MKKGIILILLFLILGTMSACETVASQEDEKLTVAVSVTPEEAFVRAVAGNKVNIVTMIPPGSSPESYQPTPRQMTALSKAKVYFSMGVPADEISILPNMSEYNPDAIIIQLDKEVAKAYPDRIIEDEDEDSHEEEIEEEAHTHTGRDPHIWLSPKRVIVMIESIRDELSKLDPNSSEIYAENAKQFITKLEDLDRDVKSTVSRSKNKTFLIYHPSYGYFADDYGLKMVAIEEGGKVATAKKIKQVIDIAKTNNIKIILYQEEFDDGQAKTISKEIGGTTVKVAPLGLDYIKNLKMIADTISGK